MGTGLLTGRLRPKRVPFLSSQYFSIRKGHKIGCKTEEMAAIAKYMNDNAKHIKA